MALYYSGCSTSIPSPQCSDCPPVENGDVRSIFFVRKDFSFADITDVSEWQTGKNAGKIFVFPYTRGTLAQAEVMTNGFGDPLEQLDSYDFTLEVEEPNYKDNYPTWNALKNAKNWIAGYRTENFVHLADVPATIIPKAPVKDGKKSQVNWMISIKWNQDSLMQPFDKPVSVFDQCIEI